MDEEFEGEDPVDDEGLNATQRRMEEEGTVRRPTGPEEEQDPPRPAV